MVFHTLSVFSVVIFGLCVAEKLDLPVPTCKRDAVDYSSCLKSAINEAWPLFVKGLPAEFDFPPLDPYFIEYEHKEYNIGDLHIEEISSNVTVEGLGETHIVAVRPHFIDNVFRLEIDLRIPRIFSEGTCEAYGGIGEFQIGGKGYYNITVEGISGTCDITGPVINDTWIIDHFRITPTVENINLYMSNLLDGNQEVDDIVNRFVNEYWPSLYQATLPIATMNLDTILSDLLNRLFSKLSFSKIFP